MEDFSQLLGRILITDQPSNFTKWEFTLKTRRNDYQAYKESCMSKKNFPHHEEFLRKYDELEELNMLDDPLSQYNDLQNFIDVWLAY